MSEPDRFHCAMEHANRPDKKRCDTQCESCQLWERFDVPGGGDTVAGLPVAPAQPEGLSTDQGAVKPDFRRFRWPRRLKR